MAKSIRSAVIGWICRSNLFDLKFFRASVWRGVVAFVKVLYECKMIKLFADTMTSCFQEKQMMMKDMKSLQQEVAEASEICPNLWTKAEVFLNLYSSAS